MDLSTVLGLLPFTFNQVLKLQQKVNELTAQNEDLRDDKKSLAQQVKELEHEAEKRSKNDVNLKKVEDLQVRRKTKLFTAKTE